MKSELLSATEKIKIYRILLYIAILVFACFGNMFGIKKRVIYMGLLRIILALSVLLSHVGDVFEFHLPGGYVSVQGFYIISGFYMALILNEKYIQRKAVFLFYSNRILRLIPLYYFFMILQVVISIISLKSNLFPAQAYAINHFIHYYSLLSFPALGFILFTNLTLFGHLFAPFLRISPVDGTLYWGTEVLNMDLWLGKFFIIPPSWTLGFEVGFYLLAPFIVRRHSGLLLSLVCASFGLRYFLMYSGYNSNLFKAAFFPNEIALFLLGSIAYKIYVILKEKDFFNIYVSALPIGCIFILTIFYQYLPQKNTFVYFFNDARIIYFFSLVIGLPFLFYASKNIKLDRTVGELSYPVYLCHIFIARFFHGFSATNAVLIVVIAIIVSYISIKLISQPIERYRQSRVNKAAL